MEEHQNQRNGKTEPNNRESGNRMRPAVHLAAAIAGLYVCYLLAVPFLPAFTWALTLAILIYPAHLRLKKYVRSEGVAALISVFAVAAVVVVPTVLLSEQVIVEAGKGALLVKQKLDSGNWKMDFSSHSRFAPVGRALYEHLSLPDLDIPSIVGNAVSWLANMSASLVRISATKLILTLITFYFLFYFLRDRNQALRMLCSLSPLTTLEMSRLFRRVTDTVYATMYGTLVVAIIQGALGGLMFWWLDLPVPVLWGVVMGILAIVPVLGAFVIWIPAALYLALEGSWLDALVLTVWGTVIIGGIDNVLYPILVGNRLKLHTVPAFVAIVGGLFVFGASGIVLGPLALTITLFLLELWRSKASSRRLF